MATYAFSDIHAQSALWTQIKNFIKPTDTVYCLGDCVDRGDVGLQILNEIMSMPNVILIKGNHEDFIDFIGRQCNEIENPDDWWLVYDYNTWLRNGSEKTIQEFKEMTKEERIKLINKVAALPTHAEYVNTRGEVIYLNHAGGQPGDRNDTSYVWNRSHFVDTEWRGKPNEYCVHGHTPVASISKEDSFTFTWKPEDYPKDKYKIFRHCQGHKIDIDLGSFITHITCLLNLDTWEEIYFTDENFKGE